jgi:uncharacterized protein (DUF1810 family)
MEDPYNLERFVIAQEDGATYRHAIDELRSGRKTSHYMWFVFPQIAGLGQSQTARHFAIGSLDEARVYLGHPVLGPRLHECVAALLDVGDRTAEEILGSIDAQKLRSSMTLFLRASPSESGFARVLDRYFAGQEDSATDRLLTADGC